MSGVFSLFRFFWWGWGLGGRFCWSRWSLWVCILWDSAVTKACGRECGDEIYWVPLCGITFPVMEPRVDKKNEVLTVETSVIEVINICGCGGYKLKKRIQFTYSAATFFGYLCPVLAACILATRPEVFVNKSLSSWPPRLIKGQRRRTKTTDVTLLIADKRFDVALKDRRKMKALGFAVLLFLCIYGDASGVQVTVSKFFQIRFRFVLFSL